MKNRQKRVDLSRPRELQDFLSQRNHLRVNLAGRLDWLTSQPDDVAHSHTNAEDFPGKNPANNPNENSAKMCERGGRAPQTTGIFPPGCRRAGLSRAKEGGRSPIPIWLAADTERL